MEQNEIYICREDLVIHGVKRFKKIKQFGGTLKTYIPSSSSDLLSHLRKQFKPIWLGKAA